ncbi:hypothetical protein BU15DRAFT_59246 [Melanogaster broomeanus]|nr:hypothetical protein BU15DRAFT_59246 [Melanogaster broomeanus]
MSRICLAFYHEDPSLVKSGSAIAEGTYFQVAGNLCNGNGAVCHRRSSRRTSGLQVLGGPALANPASGTQTVTTVARASSKWTRYVKFSGVSEEEALRVVCGERFAELGHWQDEDYGILSIIHIVRKVALEERQLWSLGISTIISRGLLGPLHRDDELGSSSL